MRITPEALEKDSKQIDEHRIELGNMMETLTEQLRAIRGMKLPYHSTLANGILIATEIRIGDALDSLKTLHMQYNIADASLMAAFCEQEEKSVLLDNPPKM